MRSDNRLPHLDEEFVARKNYRRPMLLKIETDDHPNARRREIIATIQDIVLVSAIAIMAVMGVMALYDGAAHRVAIVCQEGC